MLSTASPNTARRSSVRHSASRTASRSPSASLV
jgi:hypothetical protein